MASAGEDGVGVHSGQTKSYVTSGLFRALKFESVQKFASMKLV